MRGMRLIAVAATLGFAAGVVTLSPAVADDPAQPPGPDVVGLVVTREPGTSARRAQALVAEQVGDTLGRAPVAPGVTAVTVPDLSPAEAARVVRALDDTEGVQQVGLDTVVRPDGAPNDPRFAEQWALTSPVSGAAAEAAWTRTTGTGQIIAVVDSGITSHEDLNANMIAGYDLVEDPVVANDGNGRDPDPADPGDWVSAADRVSHPDLFGDCSVQPSSWHGTHVAGIAAAVQNNGKGISGIAPSARIQAVRALGKCGGKMSDVATAITWASGGEVPGLPVNPTPADVINLSVSSSVTCQPFLQAAIDGALSRGTSVVASAGNKTAPFTQSSPGGCYDVITVGALTTAGNRAPYSNYGVPGRDLPLFAGGGVTGNSGAAVLSTINLGATTPTTAGYAPYAGTSMAAPLVSGAAALLRARTGMGPAAVAEHLRDTARPFPAASNCTGSCGAGILDANAALVTQPGLPLAPAGLSVSAADSAVVATWAEPTSPGTAPIIGYDLQYRVAGGQWVAVNSPWTSTLRQRIVYALTNGVGYQIRVAARNVFGAGPWAESGVVTPLALPGAVQIRSVRYPSKTSARLQLRLPTDAPAGMQYRLTRSGQLPSEWQQAPLGGSLRLRGLRKGVRHTVEVRVFNALGAGPAAARTIATPVRPGAVRSLSLERKGRKATVSWREPRRTGMRLRYRLRAGDSGIWRTTSQLSAQLRALPAGPLVVQVQAWNEAGRGPVVSIMKRK
ncbi:MAG TPA: S8 family serine peptidase [Actinomycetota bacterium]|nr:S8 family serine peptidase [Actinomycetota bacterium]